MFSKSVSSILVAAAAAVSVCGFAGALRADTVTTISTAGTYSYLYDAAWGVSINGGAQTGQEEIPLAANPTSEESLLGSAGYNYGVGPYNVLSTNNIGTGTLTWHFQTAPGLAFGSNFTITAGGLNNAAGSSSIMDGSYSTDGTHFTTFYTNSGATSSSNLQVNDFALPGISGATNLYVKFDAKGTSGLVQFFYGGGTLTAPLPTYAAQSGDNPFYLSGTVTPEPAAISLLGMGGVLLLVARRKRA